MVYLALIFDMDKSEHSNYEEFMWTVKLNRICLDWTGIWPKIDDAASSNFASDLRVCSSFIIIAILSFIPSVWSLLRVWGDMILMIENLQITIPMLIVVMKLVIVRCKRTVFLSIVKMMEGDWMELTIDTERFVMMRQTRKGRFIAVCVYVMVTLAFIAIIILPSFGLPCRHITNLTDGKRPLPLQAYYYFDTNKSPQFEFVLIVQAVAIFLCGIIYVSVDVFLGFAIFHMCGQLENFRYRLNNLALWKNFDSALCDNVENHLRLIRFAQNIEDMFALLMLGLVLLFGFAFCMYGFLFLNIILYSSTNKASISQITLVACGAFILFLHTFFYCGAGEIIANQCDAVSHAIYDTHWYKLESSKAKPIMLLMLRANEPFRITAGKIFPLTMTTFCSIIKTSAGYISFLLAKRGVKM